jgi:iron(III) transport system substrate-binding protein
MTTRACVATKSTSPHEGEGGAPRAHTRLWRAGWGVISSFLFLLFLAVTVHAQTLTTAEVGKFTGPDRDARLIAGAKKEGTLSLYSSAPIEVMRAVTDAFTKKYGVKVELWRAGSEQILQRVLTEARGRRYTADVMETAGPDIEAANREKLLQAVTLPVASELMPEAAMPGRPWIVSRLSVFTIAYNTNLVRAADAPKSFAALADPKWKGRLGIEADDNNWFFAMAGAMGEARTLALFRDIVAKNGMSVRKGHSLMANLVASGEVPVAITAYLDEVNGLKQKGAPIGNVFAAPTIAMPTAAAAFARAPHPHAAVLFLDFLLSEDAQKILAARNVVPSNMKVQRLPVKLTLMDVPKYLDENAKWVRLYREIFVTKTR